MKLTFLPAELALTDTPDGEFIVTLKGETVLRTRREKAALAKYNQLREELAREYPTAEISDDEKTKLRLKHIGEQLVDENHYRPRDSKKEKKPKGSTRTFG
jgi:hypothetical protein